MKLQVLSEQNIQKIHEATLDILEKSGVWFKDCPEAIDLFRANGCDVEGDCVRIPRTLFAECVKRLPDRDGLKLCVTKLGFSEPLGLKQGQSHVGLIGNPYYLYDFEKGQRDLVESDEDDKFLVLDHLSNFKYDCCCHINAAQRDGNAAFPDYNNTDHCVDYLRRRVGSRPSSPGTRNMAIHSNILHGVEDNSCIHSPRQWKPLEKMELLRHAILCGPERTKALLGQDTPLIWCNPISPLQYHPDQVRNIFQGLDDYGSSCFIMFSPEVMTGATGPVTLAGSLAQHNAEVMSGIILTQLYRPGAAAIYGSVSGVMDMRVAEISLGNYESMMFSSGVVQMADYYGLPSRVQCGNSSARQPGVRAAVETAWGLQMAMAAGANLVNIGLLDSTLMLSLEHLVLLDEFVSQIHSGVRGMNTTTDQLALNLIYQEAHPNPDYLSNEHTFMNMKKAVHYSEFTGRTPSSYEDWYDLAHRKVKAILERKEEDVEEARLIAQKTDAVENRLRKDDVTWRNGQDNWWQFYVQDL